MKIPKPKKLPSGSYRIQLRLGGDSISVTRPTERECVRAAQLIKAEYCAGKRQKAASMTLDEAASAYIADRENLLSPASVRRYDSIRRNRFREIMATPVSVLTNMPEERWQQIVNRESIGKSPKTVSDAYNFVKTVIKKYTHCQLPDLTMSQKRGSDTAFLTYEEIPKFVAAAVGRAQSVPMLLALSSLRIAEIAALRWEDMPPNADFVRVRQVVVQNRTGEWVKKSAAKTEASSRNVPILIPELKQELERCRKPSGPVMACSQGNFRRCVQRTCRAAGVTEVTPHGLRHSFASLAYHLRIPQRICQEIGGWRDAGTMNRIYMHIAQNDIERYKTNLADFYKNAHKNAHDTAK